jgi:hypothetical protein
MKQTPEIIVLIGFILVKMIIMNALWTCECILKI